MSEDGQNKPGAIAWFDFMVANVEAVRDFYAVVVGWQPEPVDMGGHSDFTMTAAASKVPVAGICHARGANADLPPQWLAYIVVDDLDASMQRCLERGGAVVSGTKGSESDGRYRVIRDPAGAVAALIEQR